MTTAELERRPSRTPDYEAENRALTALARALADSPQDILQKICETALELCGAGSAGVSLLTHEDGGQHLFRAAVAGLWASQVGGRTPRDYGPCGVVLDTGAVQLFSRPGSYDPHLAPVSPPIAEALLAPFYADGKVAGTLWVIAHDDCRRFDAEDVRRLTSLGDLASAAYRARKSSEKGGQHALARHESENGLLLALSAGKLGSWELDLPDMNLKASPQCKANYGRAEEELFTYEMFRASIHPEDRAGVELAVARAIQEAGDYEAEYRCVWPDGGLHWINDRGLALAGANGRATRMVGISFDITERKRAEAMAAQLAAIIESSEDAIVSKDLNGIITSWNKGAEKLFGYAAAEVIGKSVTILIPPDRIDEEPQILDRIRRGELIDHYETVRRRKDGDSVDISLTVSPILSKAGQVIGASKIARDITERKRSEVARRESEERLRAIFDGTYEFIGLLSPEGVLLECNRASLEWTGHAREEIIGLPFWETPWWTCTPGAPEQVREAIRLAAGGEFVRQEVTLRSPKGVVTIFDFSLHPIRDAQGKVVLLVPEGRDITESKKAEREVERRYRDGIKLTETNRALVGAFELGQVTAIICRAARDLTGADGATFVLREGDRVRYAAEDAIGPLWKGKDFPIGDCISGWALSHAETVVIEDIYADQRVSLDAYRPTFVRSLAMTPVGPGTPVASIGVYWARKYRASAYELELLQSLASAADLALAGVRAYEQAKQARAEAEQANRLKDEFLATLSHELRNPLNSIVGYAEVLLHSPEANRVSLLQQSAEAIHRNARAQAQLVNDLLDLSRLQTGKLAVERRPLTLAPVVGDAVEAARVRAGEKQIKLDLDIVPEPLVVSADQVRLQQIVWNLVDNALKFTPKGGHVGVHLSRDGSAARLVVEDTGQGIDPEFMPHIFEMFRQADTRATRAHGGMGIGLALVCQLVELHEGRVEAYSEGPGRGARFTVRLPLHTTPTAMRAEAPTPAAKGELTGARILVLDDTQDSVEMLGLLLTGEGATVKTALSGEEGLLAAEGSDFDLVISDISMPGMDGYAFLRSLRENPRYGRTPAIALTGFGREEDVEKAHQAGFTTHIVKPIDFADLVNISRSLVGG